MGKKKEKKEKKAGKRMTKKELVKALLDFFHQKQGEVLPLKYIFDQLHLTTHPLKMLCMDVLHELQDDDYINETEKNKYKLNLHGVEMTGIFQRKSNGKNSFIPDGGGDPIFIAERNSAHAMAGDRVKIAFYAKRRGRSAEGEVIEILERSNDTFVGTLEVAKSYAFLVTENRTLANDIFIPKDKLKGGKSGDKAVVKVIEWPDKAKNPIGQVIDILGRAGDNTTEMHAILAEYGLPYSYPTAVEKAAERIPDEIPAEEIARREDFRPVTTFTIDPKDAKDFDDALSIRRLKDGLWEVGVHIADVTHYVRPHSVIDDEAVVANIFRDFGLDPETSHIICGHVPVKVKDGEAPESAGGKHITIDGGLAKAYHSKTGIGGYTLISNSQGLFLVSHAPFTSAKEHIDSLEDLPSKSRTLQTYEPRILVRDTDTGKKMAGEIKVLKTLLKEYYKIDIREKP